MKRYLKPLYRILSIVATFALLFFAYEYIVGLMKEDPFSDIAVNWGLLALSILLFLGFYALVSLNWIESIKAAGSRPSSKQFFVFMASQPYKYMPSSIFIFSSRAIFAKKLGLNIKESSAAQLLENAVLIGTNFLLFLILCVAIWNLGIGILLFVITVLFWGCILKKITDNDRHQITFLKHKISLRSKSVIAMLGLSFFGWLLFGLSFVLMNASLSISGPSVLSLLAANSIAFSASMVAIFAPGGIGVREWIYSVFSIGALSVLSWRIIVFIVDMLVGGVAIAVIYLQRHAVKE